MKRVYCLKIARIILKIIFSNAVLRSTIDFHFLKEIIFFITHNDEKSKA